MTWLVSILRACVRYLAVPKGRKRGRTQSKGGMKEKELKREEEKESLGIEVLAEENQSRRRN